MVSLFEIGAFGGRRWSRLPIKVSLPTANLFVKITILVTRLLRVVSASLWLIIVFMLLVACLLVGA